MAQQYLNYEGLLALWSKIKAADAVNADLIAELQEKFNNIPEGVNDIRIVDGYLTLFADEHPVGQGISISEFIKDGMLDDIEIVEATESNPIEGSTTGKFIKYSWNVAAGSKVIYISLGDLGHVDLNPINNRLELLESELRDVREDLDALQNIHEVVYEDINKDDNGYYINDSEIAPKTSSVVAALNELKDSIKVADLSDYYNKGEINELLDDKLDFDDIIPVSEIEKLF